MSRTYVPECWTEQFLLYKILNVPKNSVNKVGGKPRVISRILKQKGKLQIGIVDEDPDKFQSGNYAHFSQIAISDSHKLRLLRKKNTKHYLIELCSRFEEWILFAAKKAKIDPLKKYNIKRDAEYLHKFSQEEIQANIETFYIDVLKTHNQPIVQMKKWIHDINHDIL